MKKNIFRQSVLLVNLFVIGILWLACSSNAENDNSKNELEDFKKTPDGLLYKIHEDAGNPKAKIGDILVMNLTAKADTLEILNTYLRKKPMYRQVSARDYYGDYEEGFLLLGKGDSATFVTIVDSVFEKKQRDKLPGRVKSGSKMTFQVKILDHWDEAILIKEYLGKYNIKEKPEPLGYYFISKEKGNGKKAEKAKRVKINYRAELLDRTVFESTYETKTPLIFDLGTGSVIRAWEEAIPKMQIGDKIQIIVPSYLAFGPRGRNLVKPFTPVVYFIELVEIYSEQ